MAGGDRYSEQEANFLARRWALGQSNQEVYDAYVARFGSDRSYSAIAASRTKSPIIIEAIQRAEKDIGETTTERVERALSGEFVPGVHVGEDPPVRIIEPKKPDFYDPEKEWERAKKATRAARNWQVDRHYPTVKIATRRPIGIAFASDHHLNQSAAVDMDRMEEDAELIQSTPGLWCMLGGDGVDNHIKHRSAMVNSGSRPSTEYLLFEHYMSMLDRKILAMISGNHDDWTNDMAGADMLSQIADRQRVFYAPDFVLLTVELVDPSDMKTVTQSYRIMLRHQYRYNSSFNLLHCVKRMWDMGTDDFDIGVIGHHHEAGYEPFNKHGIERLGFRPGAYQITTGHSRRYGHNPATPTSPVAVLWPDRRRMVGFKDLWQGADYLRYLRERDDMGKDAPNPEE